MWILIADDNSELRAALRLLLQELGPHTIMEAGSMGEAIATLRQGPVGAGSAHVMLLDWELPRSGFAGDCATFIAQVRSAAPGCRVIAMSNRPEAQAESHAAGCDTFISRNDPPDLLVELIVGE